MAIANKSVWINKEFNRDVSVLSDENVYGDLNLPLLHPQTGYVNIARDIKAIQQSVKNIITTKIGTKPFNPTYGTRVPDLLFEPWNVIIQSEIIWEIENMVPKYDSRIRDIKATAESPVNEPYSVYITVTFRTSYDTNETVNLTLNRIR